MYLFHNKQGTHIAHNILLNVYTYLNKELYFFEEREILCVLAMRAGNNAFRCVIVVVNSDRFFSSFSIFFCAFERILVDFWTVLYVLNLLK
jgi:hypothetical protein